MSPSTRVITGADDRGRPKAEWFPEPVSASPGYGHMEPAYDSRSIERRKATPEELEAARAREATPDHLTNNNSRTIPFGARELPAPSVEEEEPPMPEPTQTPPNIPKTIPNSADKEEGLETIGLDVALDRLAVAAEAARFAWERKVEAAETAIRADERWSAAQAQLRAAWGLSGLDPMHSPVPRALPTLEDLEKEAAKRNLIQALRNAQASADELGATEEPSAQHVAQSPAARPKRSRQHVEDLPMTPNQQRILDLIVEHAGDRRAVAEVLGLKTYQSVDVALEAIGKKGLLPITLIPLLPARFAKYQGA